MFFEGEDKAEKRRKQQLYRQQLDAQTQAKKGGGNRRSNRYEVVAKVGYEPQPTYEREEDMAKRSKQNAYALELKQQMADKYMSGGNNNPYSQQPPPMNNYDNYAPRQQQQQYAPDPYNNYNAPVQDYGQMDPYRAGGNILTQGNQQTQWSGDNNAYRHTPGDGVPRRNFMSAAKMMNGEDDEFLARKRAKALEYQRALEEQIRMKNDRNNPQQQQQQYYNNMNPGPAVRHGGMRDLRAGPSDEQLVEKRQKALRYQQELAEQMREKEQRKAKEKEEKRLLDLKEERALAAYDPWGRAGSGAPMKDMAGNVVSKRKPMASNNDPPPIAAPPFQPEYSAPPSHDPWDNQQVGHHAGNNNAGNHNNHQENEHARFKFSDMNKAQQEEVLRAGQQKSSWQAELDKQIAEKKRRKEEEKRREEEEDRRLEEKVRKQQAEMQNALDAEKNKGKQPAATEQPPAPVNVPPPHSEEPPPPQQQHDPYAQGKKEHQHHKHHHRDNNNDDDRYMELPPRRERERRKYDEYDDMSYDTYDSGSQRKRDVYSERAMRRKDREMERRKMQHEFDDLKDMLRSEQRQLRDRLEKQDDIMHQLQRQTEKAKKERVAALKQLTKFKKIIRAGSKYDSLVTKDYDTFDPLMATDGIPFEDSLDIVQRRARSAKSNRPSSSSYNNHKNRNNDPYAEELQAYSTYVDLDKPDMLDAFVENNKSSNIRANSASSSRHLSGEHYNNINTNYDNNKTLKGDSKFIGLDDSIGALEVTSRIKPSSLDSYPSYNNNYNNKTLAGASELVFPDDEAYNNAFLSYNNNNDYQQQQEDRPLDLGGRQNQQMPPMTSRDDELGNENAQLIISEADALDQFSLQQQSKSNNYNTDTLDDFSIDAANIYGKNKARLAELEELNRKLADAGVLDDDIQRTTMGGGGQDGYSPSSIRHVNVLDDFMEQNNHKQQQRNNNMENSITDGPELTGESEKIWLDEE